MDEKRGNQPTPLGVAQILESLVVRERPYVESLPALKWMLRHGERSRALFEELTRERNDGPTLLELAMLLVAISEREFADCYETALWVFAETAEGRQAYAELLRLAEDAGDVVAKDRWPVGVLQRHREVDTLLAAEDDWTDPMEVLDPSCETVSDSAYPHWLSICVARRQRGQGDADRLDTVIRKIRAAAECSSHTEQLMKRIEGLEPILALFEGSTGVLKTFKRIVRARKVLCSFCGRGEPDVEKVMPGPSGLIPRPVICNECAATYAAESPSSPSEE